MRNMNIFAAFSQRTENFRSPKSLASPFHITQARVSDVARRRRLHSNNHIFAAKCQFPARTKGGFGKTRRTPPAEKINAGLSD
jgi:hypothetical protein